MDHSHRALTGTPVEVQSAVGAPVELEVPVLEILVWQGSSGSDSWKLVQTGLGPREETQCRWAPSYPCRTSRCCRRLTQKRMGQSREL